MRTLDQVLFLILTLVPSTLLAAPNLKLGTVPKILSQRVPIEIQFEIENAPQGSKLDFYLVGDNPKLTNSEHIGEESAIAGNQSGRFKWSGTVRAHLGDVGGDPFRIVSPG